MGAATALYSATCFAQGKYGNGYPYPVNLRAIIGLSGWLPGSRYELRYAFFSCNIFHDLNIHMLIENISTLSRSVKNKIEGSHEAARRAASLPIFLCHGMCM